MIILSLTLAGQHLPLTLGCMCIPAALAISLFGFGRKKKVAPADLPAPPIADEIDEETLAIICAAVAVVLQKRVQVRRIRFLQDDSTTSWSVIGRLNIMGSHLITKWK